MTAIQEHRQNAIEALNALNELIVYYRSDETRQKLVEQVVDELEARILLMVAARVRELDKSLLLSVEQKTLLLLLANALEGK